MERINKYLAKCDLGSRRKVERFIQNGQIFIDGRKASLTDMVSSNNIIILDDKPLLPKKFEYVLINKPTGYVTTLKDDHAKQIITDLLPKDLKHLKPVGRLDKETSGLILLTNDGIMANKLTHPRYEKEKEYEVKTKQKIDKSVLEKMLGGFELEDGFIKPKKIELRNGKINITISEGRNRLIRRMFAYFGFEVIELKRTRISFLKLGDLREGELRYLTEKEICKLKDE